MEELVLQIRIAFGQDKRISVSSAAGTVEEADLNKQVLKQILEVVLTPRVNKSCDEIATEFRSEKWRDYAEIRMPGIRISDSSGLGLLIK